MAVLLKQGHSQSAVARLLGVTEGTVRYHHKRRSAGVLDGRSKQTFKAADYAEAISHWRSQQEDGRVNLVDLHRWLQREHGYGGSLRSVQRYWKATYPAPKVRARRRVETPAGAQAQVDWAEFPGVVLGDEVVDLSALIVTAISKGAGAWGVINETYRRFAAQLNFHVDACQPRHPEGKGKVERHVRDLRETVDPRKEAFDSLEQLQAVTDARLEERAGRLRCPATGTSVAEAWEQERRLLTPLPETLPEPFDIVVRRPVGIDCLVSFEGRQYSVPFRFVGQDVEVRGLAGHVQILKNAEVIAMHPRRTERLIVCDDAHFDGDDTDRVRAPMPLGKMGRGLQALAASNVQQRSIDIYARLAEVAR